MVVVVDPRFTDHSKIERTAKWYADHADARAKDALQGQALAKLGLTPPFHRPLHLRIFFDEILIQALEQSTSRKDGKQWDNFWTQACRRVQKLEASFPRHHQKKQQHSADSCEESDGSTIIHSSTKAREILESTKLVIGFHPDEATDAILDFCVPRKIPFCVVPCCVFSSLFPHRQRQHDGRPVTSYEDFVQYLRNKHANMRMDRLSFASSAKGHGAGLARNTVLYMLPCDYE